jgi:hypothetical protein
VRCSKVVSNLRYTGHQIDVFVAAAGHAGQRRRTDPSVAHEARQVVYNIVQNVLRRATTWSPLRAELYAAAEAICRMRSKLVCRRSCSYCRTAAAAALRAAAQARAADAIRVKRAKRAALVATTTGDTA